MSKQVTAFLTLAVAVFTGMHFLPWWTVAIVGAVVAVLFRLRPLPAFVTGFLAVAVVFILQAMLINQANNGILAGKVADLLGGLPVPLLIVLSGLPAGIAAGLGALTGGLFHNLIHSNTDAYDTGRA